MFCPGCGQEIPVPGLRCSRCGAELPRTKGGTVVIDDDPAPAPQVEQPPAQPAMQPAQPAMQPAQPAMQPYYPAAQPADPFASTDYSPGVRAPIPETPRPTLHDPPKHVAPAPSAGHAAWQLIAPDTRRGILGRNLLGSFSLMLGPPMVISAIFVAIGVIKDWDSHLAFAVVIAVGALLTGSLEIVAGARVLKGSASPQTTYLIAIILQAVLSIATIAVGIAGLDRFEIGTIIVFAGLMLVPLILPVLRLIVLYVPSSGSILGSRGVEKGVSMRSVPFVLWAPTTTLLASPLLILFSLFALLIVVMAWVEPPNDSYALAAALSAGSAAGFVGFTGLFSSAIGTLRRSRWSVAVGGIAGILGLLALIGAMIGLYIDLEDERHAAEIIATGTFASVPLTAVLVPSLALLIGAISAGFRRPAYLDVQPLPDGRRPNLLEVLVPQEPAA